MQKSLICLMLVFFMAGCQPTSLDGVVSSLPAPTPYVFSTDQVEPVTSAPTLADIFQPTPVKTVTSQTDTLWEGQQMPIFLEVTQTIIMKTDSGQGPTIGVGPIIYFYNPESKVLMVHPTIAINLETALLVGVNAILQTPDQAYEKREIIQYPPGGTALIQISALDAETGTLDLVYVDETFSLSLGESRTFKQVGSGANNVTIVTIISNHGHLANVQMISSEDSWR